MQLVAVLEKRNEEETQDGHDSHWHVGPVLVLQNNQLFAEGTVMLLGQVNLAVLVHLFVFARLFDSLQINVLHRGSDLEVGPFVGFLVLKSVNDAVVEFARYLLFDAKTLLAVALAYLLDQLVVEEFLHVDFEKLLLADFKFTAL